MIQLVKGGLAQHLAKFGANFLARFVFTTDTFWRASLALEKSQYSDFASSTRIFAAI